MPAVNHLDEPITAYIRREFDTFPADMSVGDALKSLRSRDVSGAILYFYITDKEDKLVGVVPTRKLLTSPEHRLMSELMIPRVITVRDDACIMDACELFVMHRFLSLPVVNSEKKMVGVLDATILSDEIFDITEKQAADELFEGIGVRVDQIKDGTPIKAFRFRFPWLIATIASGLLCALLASAYEVTLAESIVLAFFLTLILGLGESVAMQSMTVTIQQLRVARPTFAWFAKTFRHELATAGLLGASCGMLVGGVVWFWRSALWEGVAIGSSIFFSIICACAVGRSVPTLLHAIRLDPKISAGPITLGLADIITLAIYFNSAVIFLS